MNIGMKLLIVVLMAAAISQLILAFIGV